MKIFGFITILLLLANYAIAQTIKVENVSSIRASIIGLSYSWEQSISQKSVVNLEFALAGTFGSDDISGNYWVMAPVLRVEPRYYYNSFITEVFPLFLNTKNAKSLHLNPRWKDIKI